MAKNNKDKQITHSGSLGGSIDKVRTTDPNSGKEIVVDFSGDQPRDYSPEAIKETLKEQGLEAVEKVIVKNEVTGKETAITIRRDGTTESNLAIVLSDPNMTRDQKDNAVSMYLFERGKESASMMVDLFRYKGQHTKESRHFASRMRFDFEMFVNMFTGYLKSASDATFSELGIRDYELDNLVKDYAGYLKDQKNLKDSGKPEDASDGSYMSWRASIGESISPERAALIQGALRMRTEAERLMETVQKLTQSRMQEKGFGIYLDTSGRPYSVFNETDNLEEVIKKDRERIAKIREEEGI